MTVMRATDIVRYRRDQARRVNRRSQRLLRAVAALGLFTLLAILIVPLAGIAGGAAGFLLFTRDLPDVTDLEQLPLRYKPTTAVTRLYAWDAPDADGLRQAVLIDEITDPRNAGEGWVAVDELPPPVVEVIAAGLEADTSTAAPSIAEELNTWWQTGTIPPTRSRLADRLVGDHLRDGQAALPGDTRRAWQDWFLGVQIDRLYSREQQLEWALNTAYYGNLAIGLDAAARVYFAKGAADLMAGEAAMLAATAANPTGNPFDGPETARRGQARVLTVMTTTGALSPQEAEAARSAPLTLAPRPGSASAAPDFARLARRELEAILGPERLLAHNFIVETTLDLALQGQVACVLAVEDGRVAGSGGGPPCPALTVSPPAVGEIATDGPAAAVIALNPATGEIEAMAGDDTLRPIGTLAQPLIYLTALSRGYTAATLTMDIPTIYLQDGRPYAPRNNDGSYLGPLRLREALAAGRNVPALQVFSWVGAGRVLETARALGVEPPAGSAAPDLTFPEQGFPASLLDLGRAFAAVGNGGVMTGIALDDETPRPATIRRVIGDDGDAVYSYEPATRETLSPELAYLLADILSDSDPSCPSGTCPGAASVASEQPVAVARGESAEGDSWDIGFTPERLIAVRATETEPSTSAATRLRRELLAWATANAPAAGWPRPAGLRPVEVCELSGMLPSRLADCPTLQEWFVPGTEPTEVDDMIREVAINRETGRLATIFTPPQLIEHRTTIVYPPEAAGWAEDAGVEPPPVEYDTIRRVPTRAGGAELSVEPWSVVSGQWSVAGSAGGDDFAYYRLAVFPGLLPEAMQTLLERGETPVEAGDLGIWDTTLFEDGLYTLLLTVVRHDGTFNEIAVPVRVGNDE